MGCEECVFYMIHDVFGYIGICKKKGKIVTEKCDEFKKMDEKEAEKLLEENGFLYCISCNQIIHTPEELREHLKGKVRGIYSDNVAAEESPAAS